jgi:hypothetical protein
MIIGTPVSRKKSRSGDRQAITAMPKRNPEKKTSPIRPVSIQVFQKALWAFR